MVPEEQTCFHQRNPCNGFRGAVPYDPSPSPQLRWHRINLVHPGPGSGSKLGPNLFSCCVIVWMDFFFLILRFVFFMLFILISFTEFNPIFIYLFIFWINENISLNNQSGVDSPSEKSRTSQRTESADWFSGCQGVFNAVASFVHTVSLLMTSSRLTIASSWHPIHETSCPLMCLLQESWVTMLHFHVLTP